MGRHNSKEYYDKYNRSEKGKAAQRRCQEKRRLCVRSAPSVKQFFQRKATTMRFTAKCQNVPCTLSWEDLREQFESQKGLCFYTSVPMELRCRRRSEAHLSLSIDKIVPREGYVKNNIVLCTVAVNLRKNDSTMEDLLQMGEWYGRVITARPDLASPVNRGAIQTEVVSI